MKPPICGVCGKTYRADNDGDWIYFADHVEQDNFTLTGPDDYEWYCRAHLPAAKALADKASVDAYAILKEQFKDCKRWQPPPLPPTLWQRLQAWLSKR